MLINRSIEQRVFTITDVFLNPKTAEISVTFLEILTGLNQGLFYFCIESSLIVTGFSFF